MVIHNKKILWLTELNNMLMVRYVDMNYSELKEECEECGIKKCSGLRKQILMILLMMHDIY